MPKFFIVWNEARNEGFVTNDEQDAIAARTGIQPPIRSTLGNEFSDLYEDDLRTIEEIDL